MSRERRTLFTLALFLGLAIAVRVLLDPAAAHLTRLALNRSGALRGHFERAHVTLFPIGYEIRRLEIIGGRGGDWRHPLFSAERATIGLDWRRLLHAELSASLRLDRPKLIATVVPAPTKALPDFAAALGQLMPAWVGRVEVRGGELLFRDLAAPRHPRIRLRRIELAAENLASHARFAGARPATVRASATLDRSGSVTLFVAADPFASKPDFAGNLVVRGLQTPTGPLDLFTAFEARGGALSGGVKPVPRGVEVRPAAESFGDRLRAWLTDKDHPLFPARALGPSAVAPIGGRLDRPDIRLGPAMLGVVRETLVAGTRGGELSRIQQRGAERLTSDGRNRPEFAGACGWAENCKTQRPCEPARRVSPSHP